VNTASAFLRSAGVVLLVACESASGAATVEQHISCALVYGALFEGAKNAYHDGMLQYVRPRMQAVIPFLQQQQRQNDPVVKSKLREIATELEQEVKQDLPRKITDALMARDPTALRQAMQRVESCDVAFGLRTYPLPPLGQADAFRTGLYTGCLAKQRSAPSPYTDRQLQRYCSCVATRAASSGVDAASTSQEIGAALSVAHQACFSDIGH